MRLSIELKRVILLAALGIASLFIAFLFASGLGGSRTEADVVLEDVPADALEGFELKDPGDERAIVSAEKAIATAKTKARSEARVREAVLAVYSGGMVSANNRLVWVVNIEPTAQDMIPPMGGEPVAVSSPILAHLLAHLLIVDAKTGAFLFGYQVAAPGVEGGTEEDTLAPSFTQVPGQ
jgi:hypothetical protein